MKDVLKSVGEIAENVIRQRIQPSQTNFFGVLEQLLHPKPLKGLSDPRWNCQGRTDEVVRSHLQSVNETLQRIRDKSADRKETGDAVGLLACTSKFEFAIALVFFSKILSPLDTLTIYISFTRIYIQLCIAHTPFVVCIFCTLYISLIAP